MLETLYYLEYYEDLGKIRKLYLNMLDSQIKNTIATCTKHNTYNKLGSFDMEFDELEWIIWHFNRLQHFFYVLNYSNLI